MVGDFYWGLVGEDVVLGFEVGGGGVDYFVEGWVGRLWEGGE